MNQRHIIKDKSARQLREELELMRIAYGDRIRTQDYLNNYMASPSSPWRGFLYLASAAIVIAAAIVVVKYWI